MTGRQLATEKASKTKLEKGTMRVATELSMLQGMVLTIEQVAMLANVGKNVARRELLLLAAAGKVEAKRVGPRLMYRWVGGPSFVDLMIEALRAA